MRKLSRSEAESHEATLELLADPDAQARVAQAEAEIVVGETFSIDEVEAAIRRRRSRQAD